VPHSAGGDGLSADGQRRAPRSRDAVSSWKGERDGPAGDGGGSVIGDPYRLDHVAVAPLALGGQRCSAAAATTAVRGRDGDGSGESGQVAGRVTRTDLVAVCRVGGQAGAGERRGC
jgi:hypothetical protein